MSRLKEKKQTRAAKGEGSFKFNSNTNKWELQFSYIDEFGKSKRKWVNGESADECYEKKEEFLRKKCLSKDKRGYTIQDVLYKIYSEKKDYGEIIEATFIRKEYTIQLINDRDLGSIPIVDIKPEDINCFFLNLIKDEYANSTIEKVWVAINMAIEEAVRLKIITKNPMDDTNTRKQKFKKKKREIHAFTEHEEAKFMAALEQYTPKGGDRNYYKYQLLIELYSGCRMGEINALTIDDVNFETGNIEIWRTVTKTRNGNMKLEPILGETTKTQEGTRYVPICDDLLPIMHEVIENYKPNKEKLLFPNLNGKSCCISTAQANSAFKRICKKAGIKEYGQHMLRHTFASRCIESDVDVVTLSKILGHTNINTTMIYVDVFGNQKRKELEKFNSAMQKIKAHINNADILKEEN